MLRTQITLGILLMLASLAVLTYTAVNEEERMAEETEAQVARSIETGADLFHRNCIRCHGERAEGVPGLCPPLNSLELLEQRVEETGWSGSVQSYLVDTIRGGRLISTRPEQYFGETATGMAMPFWGQDYGGPLRDDQIRDIAAYLMNFDNPAPESAELPSVEIDEGASPEERLEAAYDFYVASGCAGCHALEPVGSAAAVCPTHNGMGTIAAERVDDPDYSGEATDAAGYLRESIVNPTVYLVEGYGAIMPAYDSFSEQEIDLLVEMLLQQQ